MRRCARVSLGFIIAGLLALVVRSIAGGIVVDELAKTASIEPAAQDIWDIGTALLSETAWAAVINGILILIAVVLAGPSRWARRLRELAAPYMQRAPGMLFGGRGGDLSAAGVVGAHPRLPQPGVD